MQALSFRNTQFDVIDQSGQPWLRSQQIAVALQYKRPDILNQIFQKHADEFTSSMTALVELDTAGGKQQVRIFSLRGVHLLGMLSRTKVAKEFRHWALDVLDSTAAAGPALPQPKMQHLDDQDGLVIKAAFNDRHFRIIDLKGRYWFVAADVAAALGLKKQFVDHLQPGQRSKYQISSQHLNVINTSGVQQAMLMASPERASAFRRWLDQALESRQLKPASADGADNGLIPAACLSQEASALALDYFDGCRQAVRDAGGRVPAWDHEKEQLVADSLAALLIRDRRWMLTFGSNGEPALRAIPSSAVVLTPERLLKWIADPDGAETSLLPGILQAVTQRLFKQTPALSG